MKGVCSGSCEQHIGEIQEVIIHGFGKPYHDYYCQFAIEYDRMNGFDVEIVTELKEENTNG